MPNTHLERGEPPELLEGPLVDLPDVVEAEVHRLQGLQAVEARPRQRPHQVVAHVQGPEGTKAELLVNIFGGHCKAD